VRVWQLATERYSIRARAQPRAVARRLANGRPDACRPSRRAVNDVVAFCLIAAGKRVVCVASAPGVRSCLHAHAERAPTRSGRDAFLTPQLRAIVSSFAGSTTRTTPVSAHAYACADGALLLQAIGGALCALSLGNPSEYPQTIFSTAASRPGPHATEVQAAS
jgi:hypothetical protein